MSVNTKLTSLELNKASVVFARIARAWVPACFLLYFLAGLWPVLGGLPTDLSINSEIVDFEGRNGSLRFKNPQEQGAAGSYQCAAGSHHRGRELWICHCLHRSKCGQVASCELTTG